MMYWVFSEQMLDVALAAFVARRQTEGASEQQAKDEASIVTLFLASNEAARAKMIGGQG